MMTATRSTRPCPLLIVTDLDGTLLDHQDYGYDPALPALRRATAAGIPVIPNTSKTRCELLALRATLGLDTPFIVENGSAILIPAEQIALCANAPETRDGFCIHRLGCEYASIRAELTRLSTRYRFRCFGDWTLDELVARTGLDRASAQAANQREYSEALLWQDSDAARTGFIAELNALGFNTLQGGRFLSVLGRTDKGQALGRLRDLYQRASGVRPRVIALGDSDNDIAMLEAADTAIVIANATRAAPRVNAAEVIYSTDTGPAGWNETVMALLDRLALP